MHSQREKISKHIWRAGKRLVARSMLISRYHIGYQIRVYRSKTKVNVDILKTSDNQFQKIQYLQEFFKCIDYIFVYFPKLKISVKLLLLSHSSHIVR